MITKQEVDTRFPGSIRGINNVKIGQWYKKVYGRSNRAVAGMVVRIEFSIWDDGSIAPIIHIVNPHSQYNFEKRGFYTFAADCGVTPYRDNNYNSANCLVESSEQEAIENEY